MDDDSGTHAAEFGPFVWDPLRGELRRNGRRVRLTGQPREILVLLLASADRLVSREALRRELWGDGTFVDFEQGLNTAIARLRQILGDSADDPRFIETVPGLGYRFIAPLQEAAPATLVSEPPGGSESPSGIDRRTWLAGGLGIAAGAVATAYGMWRWLPRPTEDSTTRRFVVSGPPHPELELSGGFQDLAISPDGMSIVYRARADGASRFYLRSLSAVDEGRLLPAADVYSPFFSPDSTEVGYYRFVNHRLMRSSLTGGPASAVADVANFVAGASWGRDDRIVFATLDVAEGLMRVPTDGGRAESLTRPEPGTNHLLPELLPDGRAVLFTIVPIAQPDAAEVAVLDLRSGTQTTLTTGSHPRFVPTGHLLYVRDDRLMAAPFDTRSLSIVGPEVAVIEGLAVASGVLARMGQYSVSQEGSLVFVRNSAIERRGIVRVGRDGTEESLSVPARGYTYPRVSPDGRHIALDMRDSQGGGIEIYDFARQDSTPLTSGPRVSLYPVWTPDGRRVAYQTGIPLETSLTIKTVGSGGEGEHLASDGTAALRALYFFSPSATELVFARQGDEGPELRSMDLRSGEETVLLTHARNADLHPDGRFIAYQSDTSGRFEIWISSYPNVETRSMKVSGAGGVQPVWSPRGDELFYIEPGSPARLMSVRVGSGAELSPSLPSRVMDWPYYIGELGRTYDVSRPDGERFIAVKSGAGDQQAYPESPRVELVLNWFDELRRMSPIE